MNALVSRHNERLRLVEEARADVAVSNDAMKEWVQSWGSDDEKDPPACPE